MTDDQGVGEDVTLSLLYYNRCQISPSFYEFYCYYNEGQIYPSIY